MSQLRNFVTPLHERGARTRDYHARASLPNKAELAEIACRFDFEYFDGSRDVCYGGYYYDGRWQPVAQQMVQTYGLQPGMRVLDVGCAKGFLVHDLATACPGLHVEGVDISDYAVNHAYGGTSLQRASAAYLPYDDRAFDLVVSINTVHNLPPPDAVRALVELQRVGRQRYACVESYRSARERINLLSWQMTLRTLASPSDWAWLFKLAGYEGDYELIYFT